MKLLVLAGPTAAGKTAAAVHVACLWGARIVSADAMQVHRGLDIGTGKPSPHLLRRFPHACLDVRDAGEPYNAATFAREADAAIAAGGPVVVVGGTGLYLRALLEGFVATPPPDPGLRARLEALPDPHAALREVDPALAARLHPNDRVRIVRGLEVFHATGRRLSDLHAAWRAAPRHPAVRLALDRPDLDARIDARVGRMVERGLVDEVRRVLARGVPRDDRVLRSFAYRWFVAHVLDGLALDEAVRRTRRDTRRYARKQRAFLRSLGGFRTVDARDRAAVLEAAREAFGPPPPRSRGPGPR